MQIGMIGLGLIGGSMAKAIRLNTEHDVLGMDLDPKIITKAKIMEAINGELTEENIGNCDMILLALYPEGHHRDGEEICPFDQKGCLRH